MRGEADGEIEEEVDGAAVMAMPRPRGEVEPVTEPNLAPPRRAPAQRPAVSADPKIPVASYTRSIKYRLITQFTTNL